MRGEAAHGLAVYSEQTPSRPSTPLQLIAPQQEHLEGAWNCAARGDLDCVLAETRQLELGEFARRVPNEIEFKGKKTNTVKWPLVKNTEAHTSLR